MDDKIMQQKWIDESDNVVFSAAQAYLRKAEYPIFAALTACITKNGSIRPKRYSATRSLPVIPRSITDFREKLVIDNVKPNAAHLKLAELEQKGKLRAVVTQNIDGLHQAAGSKKVLELHGSILRSYCSVCGKPYPADKMNHGAGVPHCTCGGVIRPDIVLYEEPLDENIVTEAVRAISEAEVLIIGGTSLNVYPAAGLINYYRGNKLCARKPQQHAL